METVDDVIRSRIMARKEQVGVKVAEIAGALGIKNSTICNKLYGKIGFKSREIVALADLLQCSTDYLYGLRDMTDEELQDFAKNAYTAEVVNGNIVLRRMTVQQVLAAANTILKKKGAGNHGR